VALRAWRICWSGEVGESHGLGPYDRTQGPDVSPIPSRDQARREATPSIPVSNDSMEHLLSLTQGLGLFVGTCVATGVAGTFTLLGLARLERAAVGPKRAAG